MINLYVLYIPSNSKGKPPYPVHPTIASWYVYISNSKVIKKHGFACKPTRKQIRRIIKQFNIERI